MKLESMSKEMLIAYVEQLETEISCLNSTIEFLQLEIEEIQKEA